MRGKDDYYAILAESPELKKTIGILWLTWLICTTIIFTKITTGDYINFEYNIIALIGIGMYPAVDIKGIENKLQKFYMDEDSITVVKDLLKALEEMDEEGYKKSVSVLKRIKINSKEELIKALYSI